MRIANNGILTTSAPIPWTSQAIYLGSIIECALQIVYTTSSATIKLQCSVDQGRLMQEGYVGDIVTNWTDVANSTVNLTENGDLTYDIADISYRWIRIVSTGTGTIVSARFQLKGA